METPIRESKPSVISEVNIDAIDEKYIKQTT